MVIQCPACSTRFRLADEKIGPQGVSVRCSKCAHTFPVRREDGVSAAPTTGSMPVATAPAAPPPPAPAGPSVSFSDDDAPVPISDGGAPEPVDKTSVSLPAFTGEAPPAPDPFAITSSGLDPFGATAAGQLPAPAPASAPAPDPFAPTDDFFSPVGGAPVPAPGPAQNTSAASGLPGGFQPGVFTPMGASSTPSLVRAPSRPQGGMERAAVPPADDSSSAATAFAAPAPAPDPFEPGPDANGGVALSSGMPDPFAALSDLAKGDAPGPSLDGNSDPSAVEDLSSTGATDDEPSLDPSLRARLLGGMAPPVADGDGDGQGGVVPAAPPRPTPSHSGAAIATIALKKRAPGEESLDIDDSEGDKPIPRGPRPGDEKKDGEKPKKKSAAKRPVAVAGPPESRAAYRFLLALFFLGSFAGGFASLTEGTYSFSNIDRARLSILLGPPPSDGAVKGLSMSARAGNFLDTAPGRARLFIAQGVAINASPDARGQLQVRGRLKDGAGATLAESTVPCGNTFHEEQLRGFASADDLKRAYLPLGDALSNAKVLAGTAVPCMVVFYDAPPPESVAEYELEIVAAQPAS